MEKQLKNGFTLVELLIALLVAGILLGIGIPSFAEAIKNSRISANYNSVAQALFIARSEAVKGSDTITVCPRAVGDIDSCGTDWTDGMLVFVDNAPENNNATATLGVEDEVLHSQGEFKAGTVITAHASPDRSGSNAVESYILKYRSSGDTFWGSGYFRLCDTVRGAEYSRAINIVGTGAVRRGRPASSTSRTPLNVFSTAITCD